MDPSIVTTRGEAGAERAETSSGANSTRSDADAPAIERFRRFGLSLELDVVGAVVEGDGTRHVTWWRAPGSAALPIRISDVVEGRLQGWLVSAGKQGTVFARLTPSSPIDAAATLAEHADALLAPMADDAVEALLGSFAHDGDAVVDGGAELELIEHATDAVRRSLSEAGTTRPDALEQLRRAIGARDLYVLTERGARIDVSSPSGERTKEISSEVAASIRNLEPGVPVDEATLRRIGAALGVADAGIAGAFARRDRRLEGIVASWDDAAPPSHRVMELLISIAGCASDAVEERARAADLLMRRERTRLAYELHDGVTQAVTQAVLELEMLGRLVAEDPRVAAESLGETKEEIRRALGALRGMLFELSTEPAGGPDEHDAFAEYVREVAARWNLAPTVDVEGDLDAVPTPIITTAWTIVREALINAAKHSGSSETSVRATASPSELSVEIEDHGRGFDPDADPREEGHLGLQMMQTRVSELGGSIDIASSPKTGTRVVAHLPVRSRGDAP